MTETFVRALRPSPSSPHIEVDCGELALRIAKEAVDTAREARDTATESALNGARIETMLKMHLAESRKSSRAALWKGLGGSGVLVAIVGVVGQIQVARMTTGARETARETAQNTAQADDGRAQQIAQLAAREAVKQALAERARETAPLRVRPDASALARKESFE